MKGAAALLLAGPFAAPPAGAACYLVADSAAQAHWARSGFPVSPRQALPSSVSTMQQCQQVLSQRKAQYSYDAGMRGVTCQCDGSSSGGYSPGSYSGMTTKQMVQVEMARATGTLLGQMIAAALAPPPAPRGPSPEELARQQREKEEAERLAALLRKQREDWNAANQRIASAGGKTRETDERDGAALLGRMQTLGGAGMQAGTIQSSTLTLADMTPVTGGKFPTSGMSAVDRLVCAGAFSKQAETASAAADPKAAERARHLSEQAERVMAGSPTDVPCPALGLPAIPDVPDPTPVDLPAQYELLVAETKQDIADLQRFRQEQEQTRAKKEEVKAKLEEAREKAKEAKAQAPPAAPAAGAPPPPGKDPSTVMAELQALASALESDLSDLDRKDQELTASIGTVTGRLEKRQQALLGPADPNSPPAGGPK